MSTKQLNVPIPGTLLDRVKVLARKRGVKLYAAIKEALEAWADAERAK